MTVAIAAYRLSRIRAGRWLPRRTVQPAVQRCDASAPYKLRTHG